MLRLVLIRHAESAWNAEGRYQGHADSGLTAAGHAQAKATAGALTAGYPDARLLVRSDLDRVADTARYTQEVMEVEARVDPRLREIDVGTWSGLTGPEIAEADPDHFAAARRGEDVRRGGGETFADLRARVWAGLTEIADEVGTGTVLVFTHGGPVRVALAAALELPSGGHRRFRPVGNASITVLERERDWETGHARNPVAGRSRAQDHWRLAAFNRQEHLARLGAGNRAPSASADPPTDADRQRPARS